MKKLLKSIILLISLLLIVSCDRNIESDVESIKELREKADKLEPTDNNENLLVWKAQEEIYSYYINDANIDELDSFLDLYNNKLNGDVIANKEDLEAILGAVKRLIEIYEQGGVFRKDEEGNVVPISTYK